MQPRPIRILALVLGAMSSSSRGLALGDGTPSSTHARLRPAIVTEKVDSDSDDPAIWVDAEAPEKSLILGTDKGGALFVFDLEGKRQDGLTVRGLERPNNVDVEYGLVLGGRKVDIAVVTERDAGRIRVFSLPEVKAIDRGGIAVFDGEDERRVMGVGLYRRAKDGAVFAVLSRKDGPSGGLLFQYRLEDAGDGTVRATKVRAFGHWSGPVDPANPEDGNEVEAVVVDDALGHVYYSEEKVGVHQYFADPDAENCEGELALFAREGFSADREGLSLLVRDDGTGYLLVSDQGADRFHVFTREGTAADPLLHARVAVFDVSADESDGSEIVARPLGPRFPAGVFVAMSTDRTFHFYDWRDAADRTWH